MVAMGQKSRATLVPLSLEMCVFLLVAFLAAQGCLQLSLKQAKKAQSSSVTVSDNSIVSLQLRPFIAAYHIKKLMQCQQCFRLSCVWVDMAKSKAICCMGS